MGRPTPHEIRTLEDRARELRWTIAEMIHRSGTMHLGSSYSCTEILVAAYWRALRIDPLDPSAPDRDRFILSKGHAAPALFAILAQRGYFDPKLLETYCENGSSLAEHPTPGCAPGVELATGSLGHGLSLGLGIAYANKLRGSDARVFAVLSDGECNEGSVWEAALLAPALGLERVIAIVDYNKWQATGRSEEVTSLKPLRAKWEAFGWSTREIDGNNMEEVVAALDNVPDGSGKPIAVIAHTVKGKGVSFMEDDNNWHYRSPSAEELVKVRKELGLP